MDERRPAAGARSGWSRRALRDTQRLDRTVLWSLLLFLLSFPLMLVSLAFVGAMATSAGVEFGSDERVGVQQLLNGLFVVLALSPLAAAVVVGLVGWFSRRKVVALVAAVLAAVSIVAFFLLPALA